MNRMTILTAIVAAGFSAPTLAADLPMRMPVKAPVVAPLFNWTGFYGGINGGYAWARDSLNVSIDAGGNLFSGNAGTLRLDDWFGGLQAGYNVQRDSTVFGIEGDFQWASMKDSLSFVSPPLITALDASAKIGRFATVRGRLGRVKDRTLWYVTGGVAFAEIDLSLGLTTPIGQTSLNESKWKIGWAAGAGVEHALNDNWSIKLEYQYLGFSPTRFSETQFTTVGVILVPTDMRASFDPSMHTVRVGLNGRFATSR